MKQDYLARQQQQQPQQAMVQRTLSDASSIYTASSFHSEAPLPAPATAQIPRYRQDSMRRTDNRSSWEYLLEEQNRSADRASQALLDRLNRNQVFYC